MLLGLEEDEKKFRDAMLAAGADPSTVKAWLKIFSKTRKNALNTASRYYSVKDKLETLIQSLEDAERMLIADKESLNKEMCITSDSKSQMTLYSREFKRLQGCFNDEFLISKEDKDFQTTLDSVTALSAKYDGTENLILQSEVENLLYLAREGLDREKPDMFALAYFYLERSNKDLEELNFSAKIERVNQIFEDEFISVIKPELVSAVKMAEALNDRYEGSNQKRTQKLLSELEPLIDKNGQELHPEQRAEIILKKMCTV